MMMLRLTSDAEFQSDVVFASDLVSQTIVLGVGAGTTAMHLLNDVLLDGFGMEGQHYDLNHSASLLLRL